MFVKYIVCQCGEKLDERHVVDRKGKQVTCLIWKCPGCGQKIMGTVLNKGK